MNMNYDHAARYNGLLERGMQLLKQYALVGMGAAPESLPEDVEQRLREAMRCLRQASEMVPAQMAPKWGLGKAYQALGDREQALAWFEAAYRLAPHQPDVCREAGLAAMEANSFEAAEKYSREAVTARPDDAGLHANLALALMFLGRDDEACRTIRHSLELSPGDPVSRNVAALVTAVAKGALARPTSAQALRGDT